MRSRIPLAACVVLAVLVGSSAFGTNTARATVTGQDTSTLDDQVELSLTVYNSDLALVRDVRNVELAAGHVRSALHGHRRDCQSCDGALPLAHPASARARRRTELRVRPPRAREAASQVRRPRCDAGAEDPGSGLDAGGGGDGTPRQLQQCAGLADRQRDRHRACRQITSGSPSYPGTCTAVRP